MKDPFVLGRNDPTGILDWLESKGHTVRAPKDMSNDWNKVYPKCANPECPELLIDRPGALYHSRSCKEAHTLAKQRAARSSVTRATDESVDETEGYVRAVTGATGGMGL